MTAAAVIGFVVGFVQGVAIRRASRLRAAWDSVRLFGGSRRAAARYCLRYLRGVA